MDSIDRLQQLLWQDRNLQQTAMEQVKLADGEVLFKRGDPGDALYLVQSGALRIFTQDPGAREITLNQVGTGEVLGELALIDAQPRSASAMAVGPTQLLRLGRDVFLKQVHQSPELTQCVIQLLGDRVRHMTEYIEQFGLWARLIAAEDYERMSQSLTEIDATGDRVLVSVADSVRLMASAVREREQRLQATVEQLRIDIDDEQRKSQVQEITETDYFQDLLQQSRQRRESYRKRRQPPTI